MYTPPAFRDDDKESLRVTIRAVRLANFVTATADGPLATPLPLYLDESEGEYGVIYGHLAKANPQGRVPLRKLPAEMSSAQLIKARHGGRLPRPGTT